jgi:hypothetical protein
MTCSVVQAEKLIDLVFASMTAKKTSLNGGSVTAAAVTFWTQLASKLILVHGTRWQSLSTVLLCPSALTQPWY